MSFRDIYKKVFLSFILLAMTMAGKGQGLPPGWDYVFTSTVHVIAIPLAVQPTINGEPIIPGDYIGVFFIRNDSLICGGAAEWLGDESIAVVANGDDFLTTIKDGFWEGEDFNWKIYSWQYEQEYEAVAEYNDSLPNYDGKFHADGLSALTSLEATADSLVVVAGADPGLVCAGDSCHLHAEAAFGSGTYTYAWSSLPPGFTSNEQNPVAFPTDTTLYIVEVDDGYTTASDSVTVDVVPVPEVSAGDDASICAGGSYITAGTVSHASSVYWTSSGDGAFDDPGSLSARYTPGPQDIINGQAVLTLTAEPFPPCDQSVADEMTLVINENPDANAGDDVVIPYGTSTQLYGNASGGSGSYNFHWTPEAYLVDPLVQDPVTVPLTQTVIFTLTVTDALTGCQGMDHVTVFMAGGPLTVLVSASPEAVCPGSSSQLQVIPSGGSGDYSYSWTSDPPGFFSSLPNPIVYPQQTTVYIAEVDDGYSTVSDSVVVVLHPVPVADAGEDVSIPYGTGATLHGSATGGSGDYSYDWTPAFYLIDPHVQEPVTIDLYETMTFTLTVTDGVYGCHDTDAVTVTVTGGPLTVNVTATPDAICMGDTSQLSAAASGGSGSYTYLWTSDPTGFTSTDSHPKVSPDITTEYFAVVSDGYNSVSGSATVTVNPLPAVLITVFPNDTVCQNETIMLDATTAGAVSYLWTPGNYTTPVIYVDTTGMGIGSGWYRVFVTDGNGCQGMDSILVTFDNCIRIPEIQNGMTVRAFPNPVSEKLYIGVNGRPSFHLTLMDLFGDIIFEENCSGVKNNATIPIDMAHLAGGIYLIRIQSEDHLFLLRIVKQ